MQDIGFDIITDLNLSPEDSFNWEGKATSLYCLVSGNVSSDLRTVLQTLAHLSRFYHGVFYVPGPLEYMTSPDIEERTDELSAIVDQIPKVVMLHQSVVIIDGVAILGVNGWNNAVMSDSLNVSEMEYNSARLQDMSYLHQSIKKLQKHLDVKKIIVMTNAIPDGDLYFGEAPEISNNQIPLNVVLTSDTENKVRYWVFGNYEKITDTYLKDINYINNPYIRKTPYWPKRLTISV